MMAVATIGDRLLFLLQINLFIYRYIIRLHLLSIVDARAAAISIVVVVTT